MVIWGAPLSLAWQHFLVVLPNDRTIASLESDQQQRNSSVINLVKPQGDRDERVPMILL